VGFFHISVNPFVVTDESDESQIVENVETNENRSETNADEDSDSTDTEAAVCEETANPTVETSSTHQIDRENTNSIEQTQIFEPPEEKVSEEEPKTFERNSSETEQLISIAEEDQVQDCVEESRSKSSDVSPLPVAVNSDQSETVSGDAAETEFERSESSSETEQLISIAEEDQVQDCVEENRSKSSDVSPLPVAVNSDQSETVSEDAAETEFERSESELVASDETQVVTNEPFSSEQVEDANEIEQISNEIQTETGVEKENAESCSVITSNVDELQKRDEIEDGSDQISLPPEIGEESSETKKTFETSIELASENIETSEELNSNISSENSGSGCARESLPAEQTLSPPPEASPAECEKLHTTEETCSATEICDHTKSIEDQTIKDVSENQLENEESEQPPEVAAIPVAKTCPNVRRLLQNDGQIELSSFENDPSDESCDTQTLQTNSGVKVQTCQAPEIALETQMPMENITSSPGLNEGSRDEQADAIRSEEPSITGLINSEVIPTINEDSFLTSNIEIGSDFQVDVIEVVVRETASETSPEDLTKEDLLDHEKDLTTTESANCSEPAASINQVLNLNVLL
jgi:hypothetical protein